MANGNDIVLINLDRQRELRYGHKAIKKLLAMTGKDITQLDLENIDLGQLETIVYCGLLSDAAANNETLQPEQMEDLLDRAPSMTHIVEAMTQALNNAFGGAADAAGNQLTPATEPAPVNGTGKTA